MVGALDRGRELFGRQAWGDAFAELAVADREAPLDPEDLERLAVAAYLVGEDGASDDAWRRAHQECLRRGEVVRAARYAGLLARGLLVRGEMAQAGGWLARAERLLDDARHDGAERGWLLIPVGIQAFDDDPDSAHDTFAEAAAMGARHGDLDLVAAARMGQGRALIRLGRTPAGAAMLDEAMVGITAGEVSPIVAGLVYCGVIEACQEMFDFRRAQEWTAALTRWCESQPDLVPYRGHCLVYRAEIMQLHGEWTDATEEAQRACERLADTPAVGMAFYLDGELHRLRGRFVEAEESYRRANEWGRTPQPGLAQLRLAQGDVGAAVAAIRRTLDEAQDRVARSALLGAYVETMLAADDVAAARRAADELSRIATDVDAPHLRAQAAHATGAVLLAEGKAGPACDSLRRAWRAWHELDAPFEAGRVRVLIGLACRKLGDEDSARMELDAARWVFEQLGARPSLAVVDSLTGVSASGATHRLTPREVDVLRLVASGMTNKAIAGELVLSVRTVDRHVSNIFTKLGVSSRAAATAFAYEHRLL